VRKSEFYLLAQFDTGDIPLAEVAEKYFGHGKDEMSKHARNNEYPFPVFRAGSQRSQWLVSAHHLAEYLDNVKQASEEQHKALNT